MNPELTIGILVLAQALIAVFEAKHDYHVIEGSALGVTPFAYSEARMNHNKAWHKQDAIIWTLVYSAMAFAVWNPMLLLTGLAWRFVMLQIALNHFRDIDYSHLGNGTIDKWSKRILTTNGTLYFKLLIGLTLTCYAGYKILSNLF